MKKIKFYIGLDVHKTITAYHIRTAESDTVIEGTCSSKPLDVWCVIGPYAHSCKIAMECNIEIYPIYYFLKEKDLNPMVGNTIQLRTLIGKNDKMDARRISDMIRLGTFPLAFIPEGNVKELRGIVKSRHSLLVENRRVQNQIKAFTRKYGLVIPNSKGLSAKTLSSLHQLLSCKYEYRDLSIALERYNFNSKLLEKATDRMIGFAKSKFPKEYNVLIEMKGIGPVITSYLISEICPIIRFKSKKKLRRYAGVIPCSQQSAGKTYATFLPKTSSRSLLKWALIEASHCTAKHCDKIKAYYKRKKKEKKMNYPPEQAPGYPLKFNSFSCV